MKARKLPIVIDAFKLTREVSARTLEGTMVGNPGDWMLVGVEQEVYFCKDSVFRKTYEIIPGSTYGTNPYLPLGMKPDVCLTIPSVELSKEPEKKINKTLGGKGYSFVRNAPTIEECFLKFPNAPRANIERIWFNAHPPETQEPEKKIVIEPRKGHTRKNNMDSGRWTPEEVSIVQGAANVDEAVKAYREKFPDELKPLEEKKSFFVGAQVKQVSGRSPHAMGTGDIIEIKGNGDIIVEFYHERKTLKRDELAFYSPPNQNSVMKV